MEQVYHWLVELNRSRHTEFAIVTVLIMVGLGVVIAGTIELIFRVLGIKADARR